MNWLHYLLEANLYLCVFYAGYCLFLNKETHYTLNRAYLLLSCIVSFIIPVVQLGWLKPAEQGLQTFIIKGNVPTQINTVAAQSHLSASQLLIYAYIVGVTVLAGMLIVKLYQLLKLTKTSQTRVDNKYKLVNIEGSNTAFSFFNYLFIGTKTATNNIIIKHELVHIRQKHSADIVFLELIKIINWFNPLVYLLQISLKTVHEYIADEQTAAQESDAISYSSFLVSNAYGLSGSPLAHSFFNYNLLKKRIIMLNQKRSGKLARLKYLVAVPISGGLLCASTLAFSKTYGFIDLLPQLQANGARPVSLSDTNKRAQVTRKYDTSKGYKFEETGYLVNGKAEYRVIITEKNGEQKEYYKSKANPEELAILKDKYGYIFPKMMIYPKLPPPPPVPPAPAKAGLHASTDQLPPPPPAAPKKGKKAKIVEVELLPPPPPPADGKNVPPPPPAPPVPGNGANIPPPPPPAPASPFDNLYGYIAKHVRYPAKARQNNIWGRVIANITVADNKISETKIVKNLDPEIDGEVLRVLNDYDGQIKIKPGTYKVDVAMVLATEDDKTSFDLQSKVKDPKDPGYEGTALSQVVVVGYLAKK